MATARGNSREKLVDAAASLFFENGFTATSIRDIAAAVGLESASLYYHMENKEDLLYEISRQSLTSLISAVKPVLAAEISPRQKLDRLIHAHVGTLLRDQEKHAVMLTEWKALSPANRRQILALRDEYQDIVEAVFSDGQRAGVVRRDLAPQLLRVSLLSMLNWSMFWFKRGGSLTPEQLADIMAQVFLQGALSPQGRRAKTSRTDSEKADLAIREGAHLASLVGNATDEERF